MGKTFFSSGFLESTESMTETMRFTCKDLFLNAIIVTDVFVIVLTLKTEQKL